jgi:hypothetical protein
LLLHSANYHKNKKSVAIMAAEILNFIDCFDNYSTSYLIGVTVVAGIIWIIFSANSMIDYGPVAVCFSVVSMSSMFFDILTGAANWANANPLNRVHAFGSALHCICTPIIGIKLSTEEDGNPQMRFGSWGIWLGELLELSAIYCNY